MRHDGRLTLLFDVQNLFKCAKNVWGPDALVDYRRLAEEAIADRNFLSVRKIAFMPFVSAREWVQKALETYGYEVLPKEPQRGRNKDLDSLMVVIGMQVNANVVVSASGDGDFCPMYKALRERGVRVEVLCIPESLGPDVKDHVDEIRFLEKGILFRNGREREMVV